MLVSSSIRCYSHVVCLTLLVSYIDDLGVGWYVVGAVKPRITLYMDACHGPSSERSGADRPTTTGSRSGQAADYSYRHIARRALSSRPMAVVIVTRPSEPCSRRHVDCVVISHVTAKWHTHTHTERERERTSAIVGVTLVQLLLMTTSHPIQRQRATTIIYTVDTSILTLSNFVFQLKNN